MAYSKNPKLSPISDKALWAIMLPGAPISEAFDEQDLKAKEN